MKYYRNGKTVIELPSEESCPKEFHEITKKEYDSVCSKIKEITELEFELKKSDFKAIKHSEGWINDEEYAPIKADRQAKRERINELRSELE